MRSEKLKISLVANTSWSIYNFRLEVAQHLRDLGHAIYVIAPRDKHSEKLIAENFTFIEAPIKPYSINPIDDIIYFFFLMKIYRQYQFDHVFHYTIKSNVYGSIAAKIRGLSSTAVITGLGRLLNMENGWKKHLVHSLYRLACKNTDHLWFLNKEDVQYFEKKKLLSSSNYFVLPSEGVNLKLYKQNADTNSDISFLFAGRLLKEKGIYIFLEAAEKVKQYYPEIGFDIVGFIDTKDDDSVEQSQLIDFQSRGIVQFHGDTEDIKPYISLCSCVVLPSSYGEGVSRILLEAAAMSTPIIASSNRGCAEVVVDGYNGFLCEQKNVDSLVDQMLAFITLDSEARYIMGENGRKRVEKNYSVIRVIDIYVRHLTLEKPVQVKNQNTTFSPQGCQFEK